MDAVTFIFIRRNDSTQTHTYNIDIGHNIDIDIGYNANINIQKKNYKAKRRPKDSIYRPYN